MPTQVILQLLSGLCPYEQLGNNTVNLERKASKGGLRLDTSAKYAAFGRKTRVIFSLLPHP
jgi:hypothetical protein